MARDFSIAGYQLEQPCEPGYGADSTPAHQHNKEHDKHNSELPGGLVGWWVGGCAATWACE